MSKRKAHQNVHGKGRGGNAKHSPIEKKRNPLLRPVSTDAGATVTDNPMHLLIYTGAVMAFLFTLKLIF